MRLKTNSAKTEMPVFDLTQLQYHYSRHRQPKSLYQAVVQGKRTYLSAIKTTYADGTVYMKIISPTGSEYITENGKTLKLNLPPNISVKPGPDVVERKKSHAKKKREKEWKEVDKFIPPI